MVLGGYRGKTRWRQASSINGKTAAKRKERKLAIQTRAEHDTVALTIDSESNLRHMDNKKLDDRKFD